MKKILIFSFPFLPLSFLLLFDFIVYEEEEEVDEPTEENENLIRVAIVEDKAYWIVHNVLYQANVVDGEIEKEEAEPVNAFDMEFKDVNILMNILDNMQDWKN